MGKFTFFLIFLALVAFHGSLVEHRRKASKQYSPRNTNTAVANPHLIPSLETSNEGVIGLEGASVAGNTYAFQPTIPGVSGVGHRIITSQDNNVKIIVEVQNPLVDVFVTKDSKDDFKPTDPVSTTKNND
ncbi:hypothetical protein Fmac_014788 [Flemingia macrophylla]|uniref:Uncharacterized protein n=1 Tax=Flemingia macrophylla TaxID=520843 RepID=A0ABD1MEQ7_9FABA